MTMEKEEACMKQSLETLLMDLERYIEENWTGEEMEFSCPKDVKKGADTHPLPLNSIFNCKN